MSTPTAAPTDIPAHAAADAEQRTRHESLVIRLASTPTAAGREDRVIEIVRAWCAERPGLRRTPDEAGNLTIARADAPDPGRTPPLYITAHMDHPAFALEAVDGDGTLLLTFRGGVLDPYFRDARIVMFAGDGTPVRATVLSTVKPDASPGHLAEARFLRTCRARVDGADAGAAASLTPGDIGRWDLPAAAIEADERTGQRVLHADACDDLAPLATALCAYDLVKDDPRAAHVRLLLTRAEEIGFVGAIAACKAGTIPPGSRLILLEASRAYAESPVGGGPIVRVGDRQNTFTPALTGSIYALADKLRAADAEGRSRPFRVQRKLMPGGMCESSAFIAYGYESTCLCLPLGNYHNMADLAAVADDKDEDAIANAKVGREFVDIDDFHDLVTLLTAVALSGGDDADVAGKLDKLFAQRERVLHGPTIFDAVAFE